MWSREELKAKCKVVMKRNYWIMLIVSTIAAFLCGQQLFHIDISLSNIDSFIDDIQYVFEDIQYLSNSNFTLSMITPEILHGFIQELNSMFTFNFITSIIFLVFAIVSIVTLCFHFFISNPIACGRARFYIKNRKENASISELFFSFSNHYKNCVKIMFLRDVKIALWSLLFIIPGIIKSYEYRMIPMILADNPSISSQDAFLKSRQMTRFQKGAMFVLDLSFIGWYLIGNLVIIGKFFIHPYYDGVQVELYDKLNIE